MLKGHGVDQDVEAAEDKGRMEGCTGLNEGFKTKWSPPPQEGPGWEVRKGCRLGGDFSNLAARDPWEEVAAGETLGTL